jgi:hypothetical protein
MDHCILSVLFLFGADITVPDGRDKREAINKTHDKSKRERVKNEGYIYFQYERGIIVRSLKGEAGGGRGAAQQFRQRWVISSMYQ